MLGVMFDCSRNAVMKVSTVKKYADILKRMGYDTIMLYTEDTYEVDNQPFFGHLRGKYTKEEMKEIDEYCYSLGIEVIPCIQTLAHLNCMFKWNKEYGDIRDYNDILLIDDEKTYKLIEDMISSLSQCFKTNKIHIGMDEAGMVGLGKYKERFGEKDRFELINDHLHKVCDIAKKYNYTPMLWHDMLGALALGTYVYNYWDGDYDLSKISEKAELLPKDISIVYWDYYKSEQKEYDRLIKTCKLFDRDVIFAGGAWTWRGFTPDNKYSFEITEAAIKACKENGVKDVFFTVWGDDGAECSKFAILPSLMYGAELLRGNTDMNSIKEKFKEIVGAEFDSFMLMDKVNTPGGKHLSTEHPNKYLLYADPFMGLKDSRCSEQDYEYYKNLAEELRRAEGKGEFGYLFDTLEKLSDILSLKSNIGNRARDAYRTRNVEELKKISRDYDNIIEKIDVFYDAFKRQWFEENKPFGFEIQDVRLGGLKQRLLSCKNRIHELIDGKISEIPELDELVLDGDIATVWSRMISTNVVTQML